jgi:Manganese containing catalase
LDARDRQLGAYVDSNGDPTVDLRNNIAADSRAKIVYEYLKQFTDDPGVQDTLNLMDPLITMSESERKVTKSDVVAAPFLVSRLRCSSTATRGRPTVATKNLSGLFL